MDRYNSSVPGTQHRPVNQLRVDPTGAATTRFASTTEQSRESGDFCFDRGRGEDFGKPERAGQFRHGAFEGVCRKDAQPGGESEGARKPEIAVTCAPEQAEPSERQGCYSGEEAAAPGQGMDWLYETHDRQDFVPCTDVRDEQRGVDGIIQPKTRRAQILQSGSGPSFEESAGRRGHIASAVGGTGNLPTLPGIDPDDSGTAEQSDHDLGRRHGRDCRHSRDGRATRRKGGIPAETQTSCFPEHSWLTIESGRVPSQATQGSQRQGEGVSRRERVLSFEHDTFRRDPADTTFQPSPEDTKKSTHVNCPRKKVTFSETVQVFLFREGHQDHFAHKTLLCDNVKSRLRSCWHLDGQLCNWQDMRDSLEAPDLYIDFPCCTEEEHVDHVPLPVQPNPVGSSSQGQAASTAAILHPNAQPSNRPSLQHLVTTGNAKGGRAKFIEVWFVRKNHHRLCLQSRRFELSRIQDDQDFEESCKTVWYDLLGPEPTELIQVHPQPNTHESTVAHIILAQGCFNGFSIAMIHSDAFPILRKHRVLAVANRATVVDIALACQVGRTCSRQNIRCLLESQTDQQHQVWYDTQSPEFLNGHLLDLKFQLMEHESDASEGEQDPDNTDLSTCCPDDEETDDETSFVSSVPGLSLPLDVGATYPWEALSPQDMLQEVDTPTEHDVDADFHEVHQLLTQIQQENDQSSILLISFGVGLTDLGRRDQVTYSQTAQDIVRDLHRLWQDHGQYGDIAVHLVHPQPNLGVGRSHMIFIVNVRYEGVHENTRAMLIMQHCPDDAAWSPRPYAARIPVQITVPGIIRSLHIEQGLYPIGVRDYTTRLRGQIQPPWRVIEIFNGDLCEIDIHAYPRHIHQAASWLENVESFYADFRTAIDTEPEHTIQCRIHGISPRNLPLGSRDVFLPIHAFFQATWFEEIYQTWPFTGGNIQVAYFFPEDTRRHTLDTACTVFHFVIAFDALPGTCLVLVSQVVVALDVYNVHEEYVAHCIPSNAQDGDILSIPPRNIFWKFPNMAQQVHRHRPQGHIRAGDLLSLRLHTRKLEDMLALLLEIHQYQEPSPPESISLLQIKTHLTTSDPFAECCAALLQDEETVFNEMPEIIETTSFPTSTPQQSHQPTDSLQPEPEDNVDLRRVCETDEETVEQLNCILHQLQTPWTGLNRDFAWIPQDHPMVRYAMQHTAQATNETAAFHIFTDGSFRDTHKTREGIEEVASAAWAFVVICAVDTPHGQSFVRIGYSTGLLQEDLGTCKLSAQNAEATAIIAMCEYILALPPQTSLTLHCHFDATSVGFGAFGSQRLPKEHGSPSERSHLARVLVSLVERRHGHLHHEHIHAHEGNPFNEMADSIANHRRKGNKPPVDPVLRSQLLNQHPLRDWAWLQIHPQPELPDIHTILANSDPDPSPGWEDRTLAAAKLETHRTPISVRLQVASLNVGTLNYNEEGHSSSSFKTREILRQCFEHKLDIVAIQESRSKYTHMTQEGSYARIIVAGDRGHGGVELWLNTETLGQKLNHQLQVTQDVCVWHNSSRLLALDIKCSALQITICVLYAPQSGREDHEIQEWWEHFRQLIQNRPSRLPMIWLGDMNAKIGSITTSGIGANAADLEDTAGTELREACTCHHMTIPSTFRHWHDTATWTYVNPAGFRSRNDYIAVAEDILPGVARSFSIPTIDLLNGDADHIPIGLEIQMTEVADTRNCLRRIPLYDRDKAREAKANARWDPLEDIPTCPWSYDLNRHWSIMRDSLQDHMAHWYPTPKRRKRQLYFSPKCWEMVCQRKELRQTHRAMQRELNMHMLQACFKAWKNTQEDQHGFRLQKHVMQLQFAMTLHARQTLDVRFRAQKSADWRSWVTSIFESKVEQLKYAKGTDLYKITQPKRMISKSAGHHRKALPGFRDEAGTWISGRRNIALAWQAQFGSIEHAEPADMQDLIHAAKPSCSRRSVADLQDLPSIYQVESAIRQMSDRKAPGLDSLGSEVYQFNVTKSAQKIYPLLVKAAFRKQSLPEMSGGWLVPLHKGRTSQQYMPGFRAILLEPTLGRILSKSWRPQLEKALAIQAMHMQYGGRKGLAIESLHLQTRMWCANAAAAKLALSIIYVDIRAAFYSVSKQFLVGCRNPEREVQDLCHKLRIPDTAYVDFLQHITQANLLYKATGSNTITDSIAATLQATWFAVANAPQIQSPTTGSRPGDPLADLLYGFVMSEFLFKVHEKLAAADVWKHTPGQAHAQPVNLTWVDDTAFADHHLDLGDSDSHH